MSAPAWIPGEEFMTTSSEFLYLEELPQRLVCIGGGISLLNLHILLPATVVTLHHYPQRSGA